MGGASGGAAEGVAEGAAEEFFFCWPGRTTRWSVGVRARVRVRVRVRVSLTHHSVESMKPLPSTSHELASISTWSGEGLELNTSWLGEGKVSF